MSMKLFDLIYTKQHDLVKKEFWTGQLIEGVKDSVEPALKKKNITLDVEYDDIKLLGDIELLKSAFIIFV